MLASILVLALTPPAPSRIAQVVVYPDRAQVTRVAELACGARAEVGFAHLPPAADPASFRARTNLGTVEGLRSEERTRAETFAPEVKALDEAIRKVDGEWNAERDVVRRTAAAERVAAGYSDVTVALVNRELSDPTPNVKAWSAAFETALATRQRAAQEAIDASVKSRSLRQRSDDLRRQRDRLASSGARSEYFAEVLVSCPTGKTAQVELTYLVGGASWSPAYEARADEAGSTVELATFATVRQSTGEEWSQARVVLSTAVPRQDATPPVITPLRIYSEERKPERKVLSGRQEYHQHADVSGATSPGGSATGGDSGALRPAAQGLSVQLAVPDLADIAGDDTPARLFVGRTRMRARFALRAMPKQAPFAFRVADLANQAPFPLLAGPLDAFRRGGFYARYPIERVAEGESFHLTFGIEESVRIKRQVVEEIQRDKGFFGNTRRFHFSYRFELANHLPRAQEIEVADHFPVSELDDVKVAIDPTTTMGYATRADDGIVTWKIQLQPGEKRNVDLKFHVDVPSSYDSGAL